VKWQGDSVFREESPNEGDLYWYGGQIELENDSCRNYDDLMAAVKQIRRLLPHDHGWFSYPPADFLAKMERCKIGRVIYDSRLSKYVGVDEIQDPALDRWMATNEKGSCMVDCLAYDEEDAKKKLLLEFAEQKYYSALSDLEWWLANDRPMKNANSGHWPTVAPVVIPTDKLLELPKRPVVDEAADILAPEVTIDEIDQMLVGVSNGQ
jgi:hypothetical protein